MAAEFLTQHDSSSGKEFGPLPPPGAILVFESSSAQPISLEPPPTPDEPEIPGTQPAEVPVVEEPYTERLITPAARPDALKLEQMANVRWTTWQRRRVRTH